MEKTRIEERAVLVTTLHKGVFFGYATETEGQTIRLRAARICIQWTADLRGFMGLASSGPGKGCRIGPPVNCVLRDITSVSEVTPEAAAKWELGLWG